MGLAYLADGTRVEYKEYISKHPHWQAIRKHRFDFDDGRCVVCHRDLHGEPYQTHHLSYQRLGHERMRDVITLCASCHDSFHINWQKVQFWRGKERGHWEVYNMEHTARLCAMFWKQDKFIAKAPEGPNLCNAETAKQCIDEYFRIEHPADNPVIDPNDLTLFVRNKRYELFFEAEQRGLAVEEFLDEYFGEKIRGKNPLRQEAGRKNGPFDHKPESFHKHYSENKNLNMLMEEVKKYE